MGKKQSEKKVEKALKSLEAKGLVDLAYINGELCCRLKQGGSDTPKGEKE